jgi:protein Xni
MQLVLIDGLNLVRRIFAGVPQEDNNAEHAVGVLHALDRSITRLLEATNPTHALAVFDAPAPTWRHTFHPQYKAGRPPMPPALAENMADVHGAFTTLGITVCTVPGFEADDVLATIAVKAGGAGAQTIVVSTDKSMLGLLSSHIGVRHHFDNRDVTQPDVVARYGVMPQELSTYLALIGDSGQNIPGVPGIGPKSASKLINEFGSLSSILDSAPAQGGRTAKALQEHREDALLSLKLTTLRTDVRVGVNLRDCRL